MKEPAISLIFIWSEIYFLAKFQHYDFIFFKKLKQRREREKGVMEYKQTVLFWVHCALLSVTSYNCKFWHEESLLLPFSFMLHLPGWTWQEPIWLWENELYSFLSFQHLIFYNPNWSLYLPGYLLDPSVRGWTVSGLGAYLTHFHWIQRSAWLLKWVISSATQPWSRLIEEEAGNERKRRGQACVKLIAFLFALGCTFIPDGERASLPKYFFHVLWLKQKRWSFEQFYKLRLWKL